ncbi:146_t:CDS:10 [Ambispora gerdemannii]|uniref:146_t:CDS:1 n=1 Tax=Ambispora gerdemannii TaxID=144530 RepID=A0A9N9BMQ6_9GLOM|nr:146_t:CDS:10 [Ambispora gerdemannii]
MSYVQDTKETVLQINDTVPYRYSFRRFSRDDEKQDISDLRVYEGISFEILKAEISRDGGSVVTLSEFTYEKKTVIRIEHHNLGGEKQTIGYFEIHIEHDNDKKQINGNTGLKFSIAISDITQRICRIAFSFYNFNPNRWDPEIDVTFKSSNNLITKRFSTKDIFLFTYNSFNNLVGRYERFHGIGNGIIKFLKKNELIILRRNNFRITSIDQHHLDLEIKRSFFQGTIMKRTNTDHAYPPPMHKFANKTKISEEIVEHKLNNCIIDKHLFSISRKKSNKIERYNLKTGELDKLFKVVNEKYSFHEDSKPEYNKIKRYEILPIFAVSMEHDEYDESKYLAATMGDNSFTIYFFPNTIDLITRELPNKNAKIRFMAFIAKNTKLLIQDKITEIKEKRTYEKEIWIWNMPGTSSIERDQEDQILRDIAENFNITLENSDRDQEYYTCTFNDRRRKIRVTETAMYHVQIWAKNEKSKNEPETLLNIWSIPSIYSRYLKEPTIILEQEDDSLVAIDKVKIKIKSLDEPLEHSVKIEPDAMSILGMITEVDRKMAELNILQQNIKQAASGIIEKAITEQDNFRILDVRFRIVATMIEADLTAVVRGKILIEPKLQLHIPEQVFQYQNETKYNFVWFLPKPIVDKEHRSALRIASDYFQHDTVESLLKYYSANAEGQTSWMETVTQALPELIAKYPKLVSELMNRTIFHEKEIPLDKSWKFYRPSDEYDSVRSFHCEFNLFDNFRQKQLEQLEDEKITHRSKYRKTNTKYYQVPLPGVMQSFKKRYSDAILDFIYNFLLNLILLERHHGNRSPFIYLVINDKTGEIFDNPSIEAIVDFQWRHYTSVFIVIRFLLYVLYATVFVWQSYAHLNKIVYGIAVGTLFKPVSGVMCGFAYIHFTGKVRRGRYIPWSQHLPSILYAFDLFGSTLPFFGSAWMLWVHTHYVDLLPSEDTRKEDLYCQQYNNQCQAEVIFYSLAGLLLWVVFFFQMRFLPCFAISMLLLLRFAPGIGIFPQSSTFKGNLTTMNLNNQTARPDFNMTQDLDWADKSDNYYYDWDKSIEAVYFWIAGRWDQIDNWRFWPVDLITVLGSIFLATLMQNLLIGLMGKALDETALEKRAVVQMRAHLLMNYPDAFSQHRYIYYSIPGDELNKLRKKIKETHDESYTENAKRQSKHIDDVDENTKDELSHIKEAYHKLDGHMEGFDGRMKKLEGRMEGLEKTLSEMLKLLKNE